MESVKSLFMSHLFHITRLNNWTATDENLPDYRAWLRAELYLRLDTLLLSSQNWHKVSREITAGEGALLHLVSLRSEQSVDRLSQLSFAELLRILQPDLEEVNIQWALPGIPPHVSAVLDTQRFDTHELLPPCSAAEWNYPLLMKYQGTYSSE